MSVLVLPLATKIFNCSHIFGLLVNSITITRPFYTRLQFFFFASGPQLSVQVSSQPLRWVWCNMVHEVQFITAHTWVVSQPGLRISPHFSPPLHEHNHRFSRAPVAYKHFVSCALVRPSTAALVFVQGARILLVLTPTPNPPTFTSLAPGTRHWWFDRAQMNKRVAVFRAKSGEKIRKTKWKWKTTWRQERTKIMCNLHMQLQ